MRRGLAAICFLISMVWLPMGVSASEPVRHELKVVLYPDERRFTAEDRITLPEGLQDEVVVRLHSGLGPSSPDATLTHERERSGMGVFADTYHVALGAEQRTFAMHYGGRIDHALESSAVEQARGFRATRGMISPQGVYLGGSAAWYPQLDQTFLTFELSVTLPRGWDAISQGVRTRHRRDAETTTVHWSSPEPQDEIFLIAGRFTEYSDPSGRVEAMVFLRSPDEELAHKYLEATGRYVAMYERLIGPYAYRKFALVENFWETGYGMPSFTLLGPRIIRFPFILHSSYPHEILHNWWGNSVYPDYISGNWSEGLTAYLSDHLIKEQQGRGVEYRQTTLQKYADYVRAERDFPLVQFRSRHSSSSEAVGYGKALMFFHMLRRNLGGAIFSQGLQAFYRDYRFQVAGFGDLRKSFEAVSHQDLGREFDQWTRRTGAPVLRVPRASARRAEEGYLLSVVLQQIQRGAPYRLQVPVAVTLAGQPAAYQTTVALGERRTTVQLELPARPLRLDVDPEFDLFRRLDREEIPPALSQTFGAGKLLILLPAGAEEPLRQAYRELADVLSRAGPEEVQIRLDSNVKKLPADQAVMLIGWENEYLPQMQELLGEYRVRFAGERLSVAERDIARAEHSVVLTTRHPENRDHVICWVASNRPEALPGLARKLPHYHKYSYLWFEGEEPANVGKGRWPVLHSPMSVGIADENGSVAEVEMGALAAREPLAALPPVFSKKRLRETVEHLARSEMQGRGFGTRELDEAADYIARELREARLEPGGAVPGSYFQTWEEQGGAPPRSAVLRNVIGVIPGNDPELRAQSVVVGAHYDGLGRGWPDVRQENAGKIHCGADDNASGVAVLLELARTLRQHMKPDRTVVFVAFTGEEAGRRGSRYYVSHPRHYPVSKSIGMINLDTVGRLESRKLLVLGGESAREWVHIFRGAGYVTGVEVEMVSQPLDSSDQTSFQEAGVPAVQLFSGPHLDYHCPGDTAEKIDVDGLVKVAAVTREAVEYLAGRQEPLQSMLQPQRTSDDAPGSKRKVQLGTIPDYAYRGKGCRISGVVPGAPAAACGLAAGDVIIRVGARGVHNLSDLSRILRSLSPGQKVSITFLRDNREVTVEAVVEAR
jgi:acetylornithine deacetylase/succinyl-diaminopimelate desuccinylase-like protein